ncbi:MAG: hypothetical protein AAB488_00380 [Patescibacteria group bacterium]
MLRQTIDVSISIATATILSGPPPKKIVAWLNKLNKKKRSKNNIFPEGIFPFEILFPSKNGGGIEFIPKIVEVEIFLNDGSSVGNTDLSTLKGHLVSLNGRLIERTFRHSEKEVDIKYLSGKKGGRTVGEILFCLSIDELINITPPKK